MADKKEKRRGAKNPSKIFFRLMGYIFKYFKVRCFLVVVFIVISALANVRGTMFMKSLIDDYITPIIISGERDFAPLLGAIGIMAAIYAVGVFSAFIYNRIVVGITQGTLKNLREEMFAHMEKLPVKYFDTHAHGDIMSLYTNDTDTLRQLISQSIPQLINGIMTVVSVVICMFVLSVPLTLMTFVMACIMLAVTKKVGGLSGKYFVIQQRKLGDVNGYIEEIIEGQKVVKVFCHEQESVNDFIKINDELFDAAKNANSFANMLMPILANIGNISYVFTAIFGSVLAISGFGGFTIGSLASFLQLNRSFNMPVSNMSQQINSIVMALAGAERIFELLDEEPEPDEGKVSLVRAKFRPDGSIEESPIRTGVWAWKYVHQSTGEVEYVQLKGDIILDKVDFGYNPDKTVLHDIEVYAKPGEKVAFVGATGAGKTTITNLINRFYDIQDGKIRYDGININKIKKSELRRSLGMVLQDTSLFTGTVTENIRYGRLDATDSEVVAAAKLAGAHEFIRRLPDGYDTMLTNNGSNLSQGQRQLLSIARAAVANPPALILDEATSSIDTRTEKIVQEGMDSLMKGRTVFVIAHRLSTIKNSDVIMVMDHGRIIERGNHDKLIKEKGVYYQLYTGLLEQS
ncbi:MAG: ABC transporter ATP-binding protein/permease [Clostridiales bacterium]|nr:ABC transporter ATP-binding protein/permease [Clostridiales bacterium]